MKKIAIIASIIFAGVATTSCERDITTLNNDPKHASVLPSETLVASAEQTMLSQFLTTNVNTNISRMFTQQFAQTTYIDESNYDMVTRPIPRNHYNVIMATSSAGSNSPGILSALRDAKKFLVNEVNADADVKANKEAVIEFLSVFAWANLVDTYGNIPYSEAMQGQDNIFSPKYDDAKTIYMDLLSRLDAAIAKVNTSKEGYTADIIYMGDMVKWKKMANSLKFRMALQISDSDPAISKAKAEEAYASGLFSSLQDNFGLQAFPSGQFSHPVYQEVILSGRNDYVPSKKVVDFMNTSADPRREKWFTKINGEYKGGVYGNNNSFPSFSHLTSIKPDDGGSYLLVNETGSGYLLDFTEISFLRAEAAQRGYAVGGTAATLYAEAIKASMEEYGVAAADITTFIAANPYNATNWKKSIGEQAWIAMFNKGFQAWNFSRRLDFPVFENPTNSTVESVPVRMRYSDQEYVLNQANVTAAASTIGGDKVSTKIFWDKF